MKIWAAQCTYSQFSGIQFTQSCVTLCDPMDCSTPGSLVLHYLPESAQTHIHWVDDAIQPSHPLLPPSPPAFNLSQHQGLFQWVSCLHQVTKVLELQHQSFQWIVGVDFLYDWLVWSPCYPRDFQESSPAWVLKVRSEDPGVPPGPFPGVCEVPSLCVPVLTTHLGGAKYFSYTLAKQPITTGKRVNYLPLSQIEGICKKAKECHSNFFGFRKKLSFIKYVSLDVYAVIYVICQCYFKVNESKF